MARERTVYGSHIGCHSIPMSEVDNIAARLGWDTANENGYTDAERAAGRYTCETCGDSPRVGVPCHCPSDEPAERAA